MHQNHPPDEETPLVAHENNQSAEKATPLPKLQVAILLLILFCEPITSQCIYPFINQLIRELDITEGNERTVGYYAGLIESLFFIAEALTILHWSRASDHLGRKPVILIGIIGLSISMVAFGLSRTFLTLIVSRSLSGLLNGNLGVLKSMMGEIADATNMAKVFALNPLAWNCGATIGPYIGGTLSRPHERFPGLFHGKFWRDYPYFLPCAVSASICATVFIIATCFLKETLQRRPQGRQAAVDTRVSSEETILLRRLLVPPILTPVLNHFLLALMSISVLALQPLFYSTSIENGGLGMSPAEIGVRLATIGFVDGIFQVTCFAPIIRRWGARRVFVTGMISFLPLFSLFPIISYFARRQGLSLLVWTLLWAQLTCQIFWDMAYGAIFMLVTSAAPDGRSLGAINGLSQLAASVARAVGPAMATSLYAYSSENKLLGGNAVYLFLILFSSFSLLVGWQLPDDHPVPPEAIRK